MLPPPPPSVEAPKSPVNYKKIFIVRCIIWFCSLVVFSVTASANAGTDGTKFATAMGVLVWLFNMAVVGNFISANFLQREIMPVSMIENKFGKPADALLLFLFYTSTVCLSEDSTTYCALESALDTADKSDEGLGGHFSGCSKLQAAAVFAWFTSIGMMVTIFLRDPESFKNLVSMGSKDSYDDIDAPRASPKDFDTTNSGDTGGEPQQKVVDL